MENECEVLQRVSRYLGSAVHRLPLALSSSGNSRVTFPVPGDRNLLPSARHVRHITNVSPVSNFEGEYERKGITQGLGHNRTRILDAIVERRPESPFLRR